MNRCFLFTDYPKIYQRKYRETKNKKINMCRRIRHESFQTACDKPLITTRISSHLKHLIIECRTHIVQPLRKFNEKVLEIT